ncbi:hypothetical protein EDC04DRAFT_2933450 [Pisolithus marmoratus]|nr:hypothetical protein EDC04DRAFT_2933450 [Pisolithus marmoratus]
MDALSSVVSTSALSLHVSLLPITFNPTAWNIVARNEYRKKIITRAFGSPCHSCYFLVILIFAFGLVRDHLYCALLDQPHVPLLPKPFTTLVLVLMFTIGQILMDNRVGGFPFNLLRDHMYVGSMLCFAATALRYERPAGLLNTLCVYIVYLIALRCEGPFTDMIYLSHSQVKKEE